MKNLNDMLILLSRLEKAHASGDVGRIALEADKLIYFFGKDVRTAIENHERANRR